MISLLPAQRRAEEFAELVESDQLSDDVRARHRELLATVSALRSVEAPVARPEFVSDLRAQLMTEADVALTEVDSKLALPTHPRSRRDRRLAVVGGTVALLGATTSVAVAAQGALPGDTLYPIKRVIEGAQSSLSLSDDAKAETQLSHARDRLSEVEALALKIDAKNADRVPATLDDFSSQAGQAADLVLGQYADDGDVSPVRDLGSFVDKSMRKLVSLDALLPSAVTGSLNNAAEVLSDINDRVARACPDCTTAALEVPKRLVQALALSGPQVSPSEAAEPTRIPSEPDQYVDPDQIPEIPVGDDPTPHSGGKGDDDSVTAPVDKTTKKAKKTVDKTVTDLGDAVDQTTENLLGEDGILPLGPIVNDLLGGN
ncbi:hypothetical protein ASG90_10210 [Nocardioides sp. Soil797]|nr:hypothetical protein ASG90_10210 [Nocardioides sp. Soil797]